MTDTRSNIKKLYGIGEARAAKYAKLGIHTVADLLSHYPKGYENRADVRLLKNAPHDEKCAVVLTVATAPRVARLKSRMTLLKFKAFDESGVCDIIYFNQDFLKSSFPIGSEFRFYGKVQATKSGYTMSSPIFEPCSDTTELPPLVSVYPLTEGLSQKQIAKDMRSALTVAAFSEIDDFLPDHIRSKYSLCTRSFAQKQIHAPDSFPSLAKARKRLIFDELFIFALGVSLSGSKAAPTQAPPCPDTDISALLSLLPYTLTDAQKRCVESICSDMSRRTAMNRMIVGDVGSGKTVCAAIAIYIAVKNGYQAMLMAPTEILATQHYADVGSLLSRLGIRTELLVGSMTAAQKRRVQTAAANGDCDVLIGTQALISQNVALARPCLVVADEQHRFGVNQRALLAEKNALSHMLVMSATPIPRSLALAMYGGLDVSKIDELPPGRQRVDTYVVDEGYRDRLHAFIAKQVESGGKIYIVCPTVEQQEDEEASLLMNDIDGEGRIKQRPPLKSAVGYAEELSEVFPNYVIAFLHGKMKSTEKDRVMHEFSEGNVNILVSTTVIEVGVNVPEACLMIVENAERFGLSQLHQLRGRVGRGTKKSYCVLVSDAIGTEGRAKERLMTMKSCYNGFEIAEKDLLLRGPGDFLKSSSDDEVRQSGGVKFKLAELCDDAQAMHDAFREASELLALSPDLSDYPAIKAEMDKMFTLESGTVN